MKQGKKSLVELAQEIVRRAETKRDFTADTREMQVVPGSGDWSDWDSVNLEIKDMGSWPINNHTHGQIGGAVGIPKKYYDRMLVEEPNLLALNVNTWFREQPKKRMVRTIEAPLSINSFPSMPPTSENLPVLQHARAFLSNRYRIMDNEEIVEKVLPVIANLGKVKFESMEVTGTRMYLKVVFPWIEREVKHQTRSVGDVVQAGLVLGNSEIGAGATYVDPLVYRLSCLNGARMKDYGLSKYHLGRISGEGRDAIEFFKDETLKKDDEAFLLKLADVVRAAADDVRFNTIVEKMEEATENDIKGDVVEVCEVVQKKFGLSDGEKSGVLQSLIKGGDLTQYGLSNAITEMSQDQPDYDRASDLERLGGQVIELKPSEWKTICVTSKKAE